MMRLLTPRRAKTLLGLIRLVNGAAALVAPATMARRLHVDPDEHGPALYALRLFGVRTVLIGIEYLRRDTSRLALYEGVVIHAADTASAVSAARSGLLPRRAARTAVVISSINTALALYAAFGRRRSG